MLVSIIIPVYNVEKYLNACLESVVALRQDVEILLVDDGSKDGSGKLCDEWAEKDSRVRVIHQKNAGLSGARNTGIRNSTGDYLLFLDSDDFLDVQETERLLSALDKRYDVTVGLYRNYYETDDLFENEDCKPFLQNVGEMERDRFVDVVPKDGQSCYLTAWRFVVRRDFLIDNGYFFCEGIYHEDEEWVPRWLKTAKTIYMTDCWFYQYRQGRKDSIMGTVRPKHIWDSLIIMEHDKELLKGEEGKTPYVCFLRTRMAGIFLNVLLNLSVLNKTERKEAVKRLRADYPLYVKGLVGGRGKLIRAFKFVFGIRFTGFVLRVANKIF